MSALRRWLGETHGTRFELLRHFLARFFDSDLVATPGEWVRVAIGVGSLLFVASLLLFRVLSFKYKQLEGRGLTDRIPVEIAADEQTMMALAICGVCVLAALFWQSIYPTLRDYLALAAMPVRSADLFAAKFAALLIVLTGFVAALLTPAACAFWFVTGEPRLLWTLPGTAAFAFFCLLAFQGAMLNLLPGPWFDRVSVWVQASLVAVGFGSTAAVAWQAGILPSLRVSGTAVTAAFSLAVAMYLVSYHRHRRLLLEVPAARTTGRNRTWIGWILERAMPDPREQAAFAFLWKTLSRSRVHRLALLTYGSVGVAWVMQSITELLHEPGTMGVERFVVIAAPVALALFLVLGLRYLFSLPTELRAGWMFQMTEREGRFAWLRAMERFVIYCGVTPVLALGAAVIGHQEGLLHGVAWAILAFFLIASFYEYSFRGWRKLPFTCSYLPGKRPLAFTVGLYMALTPMLYPFAWLVFTAAGNAASFLVALTIEMALWWRWRQKRMETWGTLPLLYVDRMEAAVDALQLAESGTIAVHERFQSEWSDYLRYGVPVPVVRPMDAGESWRDRLAEWLRAVPGDLRLALRALVSRPGFAAGAILTLGLGLGLNTAFFTVFRAFVLTPATVRDPHSLVSLGFRSRDGAPVWLNLREYDGLRSNVTVLSETFASEPLITGLDGRPAVGILATGNYFRLMGVGAAAGHVFEPSDAEPVVVLSDTAWRSWFGADPGVVGRKVRIQGHPFEVIGVARASFTGLGREGARSAVHFWAPLEVWNRTAPLSSRRSVSVGGRLRPGVSEYQARSALTALARRITVERAEDERARWVDLETYSIPIGWAVLQSFIPVLLAFALTMLIPCANTANMLLARAVERRREIGIRLSLGASRGRVVRQLLTEGLVIAVASGVLGLVVARVALNVAVRWVYDTMPPVLLFLFRMPALPVDAAVFSYMLALAAVTTLVFALAPAVQATRPVTARGVESTRMRNGLVVAQVAVCALLLIGAGVMVRAGVALAHTELGFEPRSVYGVAFENSQAGAELTRLLSQASWVDSFAFPATVPPEMRTLRIHGQQMDYNLVSHGYFRTMRIPLRKGRDFTQAEAESTAPVAVISETAARLLWPDEDPIGKTIAVEQPQRRPRGWWPKQERATVIGVSGDIVNDAANGVNRPSVHFPIWTQSADRERFTIPLVRGKGSPEQTRQLLEEAVAKTSGAVTGARVIALQEAMDWDRYPHRIASSLSSVLGALALLLTIAGMYGVMSYLVNQRRKELGIRTALGATSGGLFQLLLGYAARLTAVGLALGAMLALGVSQHFASRFGTVVNVYDATAYLLGLSAVAAFAVAAAVGPALRGARRDPIEALRAD